MLQETPLNVLIWVGISTSIRHKVIKSQYGFVYVIFVTYHLDSGNQSKIQLKVLNAYYMSIIIFDRILHFLKEVYSCA